MRYVNRTMQGGGKDSPLGGGGLGGMFNLGKSNARVYDKIRQRFVSMMSLVKMKLRKICRKL